MKRLLTTGAVLALALTGLTAASAGLGRARRSASRPSCYAPAGDPAPGTPEWQQRDTLNQYCATLRIRDQVASPAFGFGNLSQGAVAVRRAGRRPARPPDEPQGGVTTLVPGSKAADPFRTIERWTEAGPRPRRAGVSSRALNGSTLRGHVFLPPASVPRPKAGYPGVVITDGSVQAYEELYYWAAEDLAEAGYMVMTYDVQGQGDSDLFGADCPGACTGVPYQQNCNFFQGAEDSLSFFLSRPGAPSGGSSNPYADRARPPTASASPATRSAPRRSATSASATTASRRSSPGTTCARSRTAAASSIPAAHRTTKLHQRPGAGHDQRLRLQHPATATAARPATPRTAGYQQVAAAGLDAQIIVLRGATHLTYTYIPLVFQANELGERMASYYTKAWFDLHLRGDRRGLDRLTATAFDDSVDGTSIGAGVFDPALPPTRPTPTRATCPTRSTGIAVADAVSFYYRSAWSLKGAGTCADVRAGCAPVAPAGGGARR